jgi:hypothetical protein
MATQQGQTDRTRGEATDALGPPVQEAWRNHGCGRDTLCPAQNLWLQGNRPLHPGLPESALADEEISQGADGGYEKNEQQPCQG